MIVLQHKLWSNDRQREIKNIKGNTYRNWELNYYLYLLLESAALFIYTYIFLLLVHNPLETQNKQTLTE